ncbi:Na+/H+ antiporter subunit C [Naumannella sp. ID2617S]|uniref:Na+/H+ antiporter subunit C n=1 Tax=Enemella dayhoffiae TaxID=2016507 RepID=A0A255GQJ5_9ACTN|nr:NADH-quinone oxidoreductase subunit K [Enemella dayhoffiae]NNG18306.1 Na+/H+ antiporter subunit C [Naumannella sp. ID2617S]OYO18100.1 Na+/H+ antiporter subunit C [Enemella dayhoffiae]
MSPNLTLCLVAGGLVGLGVVLLLSRSLVRALLGVLLISNGVNVVFLVASGRPGAAPLTGSDLDPPIGPGGISDPLPQAMVLTAIVITLAVTAFSLALAHRSWQVSSTELLADDAEGVRTHELAVANDLSDSDHLEGDATDTDGDEDDREPERHPTSGEVQR